MYSSCNKYCDPRDLKLLDEVEYGLVRKNGRLSADEIKKLPAGTISGEVRELISDGCGLYIITQTIQPESHEGTIYRQMKNSDNAVSTCN